MITINSFSNIQEYRYLVVFKLLYGGSECNNHAPSGEQTSGMGNTMKVDDLSISWPVPDRDVPLQLGLPIKTKFSTLKDEDLFHFRISNHQAIPHSNSKQVFNVKFTKSILYSHGFPMVFLMKMADVSRLFSVKAPNTHRCRPRGARGAATTPCWCGGR